MIDMMSLEFDDELLSKAVASVDGSQLDPPTCEEFALAFGRNVGQLEGLDAPNQFLAIVCGWRLRPDDEQMPFESVWHDIRIADLTESQLAILDRIAPKLSDPELRARLSDIVWISQRKHAHARKAAEDYLSSAERLISRNYLLGVKHRLARSVQLALLLGPSSDLRATIVERITQLAETGNLQHCTLADCLRVLSSSRVGDPARLHGIVKQRVELISSTTPNPIWEQGFWDIAAGFAKQMKDDALSRAALIELARAIEREAENAPSQAIAAHHWERALQAYRRVSGTKPEQDRVHQNLLTAQEQISQEMVPAGGGSVDISDLHTHAIERMRDKTKQQAIAELVFASHWLSQDQTQKQAEDLIREHPLLKMFASLRFSSTWKVAAKSSGVPPDASEIAADRLHAETCEQYRYFVPFAVHGSIEPMRYQLRLSHTVTRDDIAELVFNSPSVPIGREDLFTIGIHAGIHGRFIEALHVLIPQLEHLLRILLKNRGVVTSGIDQSGIQKEFDLNILLTMQETEKLLGLDLVFALRVIFTERNGYNLRNEMAHGMLPSSAFFSEAAIYAWWLIVIIVAGSYAKIHLSETVFLDESDSKTE